MEQAMRSERTRASMAVITAPGHREEQPHYVKQRCLGAPDGRRSGPVTGRRFLREFLRMQSDLSMSIYLR